MSNSGRTYKARIQAYDNIAVGSALGSQERTIAGALPPDTATFGPCRTSLINENIAVGTDYGADENIVSVGTNMALTERLG